MIYTHKVTGEKVAVKRNCALEYVLPGGKIVTKYALLKEYKFDKKASKPIRSKIIKETRLARTE